MEKINIRQEFARTVLDVAKKDKKLFVMVGDISHGVLKPYYSKFPDRYLNLGILEPSMISMGAGLSRVGYNPILHTISPFIVERSFEQIKLDFCYHNLSGNIITVGGAFDYSNLGCSHHCYGDFAMLKTLPNVNIFTPASPIEFSSLFKKVYNNNKLNYFRLNGQNHGYLFNKKQIKPGEPIKVAIGNYLTLIAVGSQLKNCIEVCNFFEKKNKKIDLIYIHSIRPLNLKEIRKSAKRTKKILIVEEHSQNGGVSEDIFKNLFNIKDIKIEQKSIEKFITSYGSYTDLCKSAGLDKKSIIKKILTSF